MKFNSLASSLLQASAVGLCIIFLYSCDNDELRQLENSLRFENTKVAILKAKDTVNLIKKINYGETHTSLVYESGDSVLIDNDKISSIDEDDSLWIVTLIFKDKSVFLLPKIGELTIKGDDIIVDPYFSCQLCAIVNISIPVKSRIFINVHGKPNGGVAIQKKFTKYSEYHEVPILGLYGNWKNVVEITVADFYGNTRTSKILEITTKEIGISSGMEVTINSSNFIANELYFSANKPIGFDRNGEVRWIFQPTSKVLYLFQKLRNGNILAVSKEDVYVYHSKFIYELSPLGLIIRTYEIPNYWHHDIVELPNGNLLALSNSQPIVFQDGVSEEETIVEIDRTSGALIDTWDFNNILDPLRPPIPSSRPDDWLHLNAIVYNEMDNSIVVSGRSQSAVIKLDYSTKKIKWILSSHGLWNESFKEFLLRPIDDSGNDIETNSADFWPYGQHSPKIKPNGNLILYDNGDSRNYYEGAISPIEYSRLAEYRIDESKKTIQLVSSFDNNKSIYTKFTGAVAYQPKFNSTLIAYMYPSTIFPQPKVIEIDNDGSVQFEANFSADLANYRGFKMDVYQYFEY